MLSPLKGEIKYFFLAYDFHVGPEKCTFFIWKSAAGFTSPLWTKSIRFY